MLAARGARSARVSRRARETGDPACGPSWRAPRRARPRPAGEDPARLRALLPAGEHRRAAPPHPPPARRRARGRRPARVARRGIRACARPGSTTRRCARPREHVSLELVLTAHPTEATRRTMLQAHVRLARAAARSTTRLPRASAMRATPLAEEITVLWQTDEVRRERPRVVDEIRHGLWFFEQSLLDAAEALFAAYRRARPGRAAAASLRHAGSAATWTATRTSGPATIARGARARARAGARPLPGRGPRARGRDRHDDVARGRLAGARWSRSRATSASSRATRRRSASRTATSRTAASSRFIWWRLGERRLRARRRAARRTSTSIERSLRAHGGAPHRGRAPRRAAPAGRAVRLPPREARRPPPRRRAATRTPRVRESLRRRRGARRDGTASGALDTVIVSGTASADDVLAVARPGRGAERASRSCRCSRRSRDLDAAPAIVEPLLDEPRFARVVEERGGGSR